MHVKNEMGCRACCANCKSVHFQEEDSEQDITLAIEPLFILYACMFIV
jgi:hypothetical protein